MPLVHHTWHLFESVPILYQKLLMGGCSNG